MSCYLLIFFGLMFFSFVFNPLLFSIAMLDADDDSFGEEVI